MGMDPMNVATALNRKYLRYAAVMLWSLCENNPGPVRVFLLHSELTEDDIRELKDVLRQFEAEICDIKIDRTLFGDRLPYNEQWSIETYYRLQLPDLLPPETKRLFYIDVDIIVNKSLRELYAADFQGNDLLATEDSCGTKTWELYTEKQKEVFQDRYQAGFRYFNAGFILMNMAQIRKSCRFETYQKTMEAWNYQMSAPDQDILNDVHWEKTGYLDYNQYDLFARIAHNCGISYEHVRDAVSIVHYAGDKPWDAGSFHFDIERLWWDYAKKTPYYQELLEEFLYKTMTDTCLEEYVADLLRQIEQANNQLKESLGLNQRLLAMLQK